jgi:hypothetical protein
LAYYATEAAMLGVPQVLANPCTVDGGKKVHNVVGAVAAPIEVAPSAGAVPPEMLAVVPAADTAG